MKTSIQWIEEAKKYLKLDSDRQTCLHFGWSTQTIQDIRSGKKSLNNTEAANIAEVLQKNPLVLIADAETERAKDNKTRLYWSAAAKKFAGIAASILLVSGMMVPDSHASSLSTTAKFSESFYIMLNAACGDYIVSYWHKWGKC